MTYDAQKIKQSAAGRWREILSAVADIDAGFLDSKHGDCPKCGGVDRFRAFDDFNQTGGVYCNQCHAEKNGDGFSTIMWMLGCDFPTAVRLVAEWLGVNGLAGNGARPNIKPRIVATYDYRDERGELLYQSLRYEPKGFRQRQPKPGGGWIWSTKGVRHVPFRLPELIVANPDHPAFVVEGEKDALRLAGLGCVATTNVGGAEHWDSMWSNHFAGRRVVILVDNDRPGKKHGQQVAASLHGTAASVKVVLLPGLPEKGDVSDWLDQGHTLDELWAIVLAAPEWEPIANVEPVADDWPDIVPLDRLPDAPIFDPAFLPKAIQPWIEDIAERTQAPLDYPAITAFVALASTTGRQLTIRPKRCDDWSVVPNLWGLLIGVPSAMKTPSLQAALGPLRKLEVDAKRKYARAMAEWEQLAAVRDEQAKLQQRQIRQATAYDVFEQLSCLPVGIGEQDEFDDLPYLRFSPAAQEMFDDWRGKLERHLRSGSLNEAMESHLAKYRSLIPSLALVSSLADGHHDAVDAPYLDRAIRMGAYLEGHALKLYARGVASKGTKAADALLARIKDGQLKDGFTARDIYRREWSGLTIRGDVEAAIGVLIKHGYVALRPVNTGGKPRNEYRVNPAIFL